MRGAPMKAGIPSARCIAATSTRGDATRTPSIARTRSSSARASVSARPSTAIATSGASARISARCSPRKPLITESTMTIAIRPTVTLSVDTSVIGRATR
jgi:hypothetical protein